MIFLLPKRGGDICLFRRKTILVEFPKNFCYSPFQIPEEEEIDETDKELQDIQSKNIENENAKIELQNVLEAKNAEIIKYESKIKNLLQQCNDKSKKMEEKDLYMKVQASSHLVCGCTA